MEKDLEAYVGRQVRKHGGLWLKWVSPGCTGVPDRILAMPGGRAAFVEMKQEGGRVSRRQAYMLNKLHGMGFPTYVIFNKDQAHAMLREVMGDEVHPA